MSSQHCFFKQQNNSFPGTKFKFALSVKKLLDLVYVKFSLILKPFLANHWQGFPGEMVSL